MPTKKPIKRTTKQDEITDFIVQMNAVRDSDDVTQRMALKEYHVNLLDARIEKLTQEVTDLRKAKKDIEAEIAGYRKVLERR